MTVSARQLDILKLVRQQGSCTIDELAEQQGAFRRPGRERAPHELGLPAQGLERLTSVAPLPDHEAAHIAAGPVGRADCCSFPRDCGSTAFTPAANSSCLYHHPG